MVYTIIYRVSTIEGGAGFLPSTVSLDDSWIHQAALAKWLCRFAKDPNQLGTGQNHAEPSNTREKYDKPMENPIIDHKITIFIGGNYHPQMYPNPGGGSHEVGSATWLNPITSRCQSAGRSIMIGTLHRARLPFGKHTKNDEKSPCYQWVNPLFQWPCSIAILT